MKKSGKHVENARKKVEAHPYKLGEAAELLKKLHHTKFNETVELAINLGVDPKHSDQVVRGTVGLPNGLGKTVRVLVIAGGEKVREAQEAGADFVGGEDVVQKIMEGWTDFDAVIATPDMMRSAGKLGKVLGPRGLMPNPKTGTVTFEVAKAIKEVKAGKVEFRVDNACLVDTKFHFSSLHFLDRLGDFESHCAGLGVRHQAARAEHFAQLTGGAHHVRSGDHRIVICPPFHDFLNDFVTANEIRPRFLRFANFLAARNHQHAYCLAESIRQTHGAADDLVGMLGVHAQINRQLDGFVELRMMRLLQHLGRFAELVRACLHELTRLLHILSRLLHRFYLCDLVAPELLGFHDFQAHVARRTHHSAHRGLQIGGVEVHKLDLRNLFHLLLRDLPTLLRLGSAEPFAMFAARFSST